MEDRTKDQAKPSRRAFTKSIAAALMAAPFASSPAAAAAAGNAGGTRAEPDPGRAPEPLSMMFTHLPIDITGGSFHLQIQDEIEKAPSSPLTGYNRYVRTAGAISTNGSYDEIARVEVLKESRDYLASWEDTFYTYTLGEPAKLRIWLQRWRGNGTHPKFDFYPLDTNPTVIIKGDPFELLIDQDFDHGLGVKRTHKKYREWAYEAHNHGSPSGKGFRIRKYDIVRLDNTPIPDFGENPVNEMDVPDFRFMVACASNHRLLVRENVLGAIRRPFEQQEIQVSRPESRTGRQPKSRGRRGRR